MPNSSPGDELFLALGCTFGASASEPPDPHFQREIEDFRSWYLPWTVFREAFGTHAPTTLTRVFGLTGWRPEKPQLRTPIE